jgi:hypothetical protein
VVLTVFAHPAPRVPSFTPDIRCNLGDRTARGNHQLHGVVLVLLAIPLTVGHAKKGSNNLSHKTIRPHLRRRLWLVQLAESELRHREVDPVLADLTLDGAAPN